MFFAWSIPADSAAAPDSPPSAARDSPIWPVSTGASGLTAIARELIARQRPGTAAL